MWDGVCRGIPQRSSVSATVERGLSFLWFNWARNHFRCNTRADAAAMSSNHRKSSTSLSPTRSLYSTIIYLPCHVSPFNPTLYVESKKPPSFQSSRVVSRSSIHLSILRIPTDDVFEMHSVWLKRLLDYIKSGIVIIVDSVFVLMYLP